MKWNFRIQLPVKFSALNKRFFTYWNTPIRYIELRSMYVYSCVTNLDKFIPNV